jgi:hypothetical protein
MSAGRKVTVSLVESSCLFCTSGWLQIFVNFHFWDVQQNLLPHSDFVKTGQSDSVNHDELKAFHLQDTEYDRLRIPILHTWRYMLLKFLLWLVVKLLLGYREILQCLLKMAKFSMLYSVIVHKFNARNSERVICQKCYALDIYEHVNVLCWHYCFVTVRVYSILQDIFIHSAELQLIRYYSSLQVHAVCRHHGGDVSLLILVLHKFRFCCGVHIHASEYYADKLK